MSQTAPQPDAGRPSPSSLVSSLPEEKSFSQLLPPATLVKIGLLAALLVAMHLTLGKSIVMRWYGDPTKWGHGFVIPLFSLYLIYSRRDDILRAPRRRAYLGLLIMLAGIAGEIAGIFPINNHYISYLSIILVLLGLVLYLGGYKLMRIVWLPILFLFFAMPLPDGWYTQLSVPLQNLAARGAVAMLRVYVTDIANDASRITLISQSGVSRQLTVAEACSGMHLLMAFMALGVAMAYLDYKPIWQRVVLVLAAVPIAVFCNVVRVAITAHMFYIDREELGQDFMHAFTGILMLIPAFGLLWVLGWIMRLIFVEVDEEPTVPAVPAPAKEAKP
jgi:exosortase